MRDAERRAIKALAVIYSVAVAMLGVVLIMGG